MKQKLNSILLIDDNQLTNLINEKLIRKSGIADHIYTAENGQHAIEYLKTLLESNQVREIFPELILLDINMPVMDGWEFLTAFGRIHEILRDVPVTIVMLSTSPNPDDRQKALSYDYVVDYKVKPLTAEIIDEILQAHFSIYL